MLKDFSFNTLIENIPSHNIPPTLNIVLEGGCMNGAFEIGGLMLIKQMEKQNKLKINKISGVSVGSYAAFLYLTDNLDLYVSTYNEMKSNFKNTLKLNTLYGQLKEITQNLTDKEFSSLQNNKLFISFYNISTGMQQIKQKYSDRDDLVNSILKSCHIPFLIDGNCFYKSDGIDYIDGGVPYIPPTNQPLQTLSPTPPRTLYMTLTRADKVKTTLNVKDEKTIHGRILEGIIDTYNFFLKSSPTPMCSYVELWSLQNRLTYKIYNYLYKFFIYGIIMTKIFTNILIKIHKNILINTIDQQTQTKINQLYDHFSPILIQIYEKIIIYLVFM